MSPRLRSLLLPSSVGIFRSLPFQSSSSWRYRCCCRYCYRRRYKMTLSDLLVPAMPSPLLICSLVDNSLSLPLKGFRSGHPPPFFPSSSSKWWSAVLSRLRLHRGSPGRPRRCALTLCLLLCLSRSRFVDCPKTVVMNHPATVFLYGTPQSSRCWVTDTVAQAKSLQQAKGRFKAQSLPIQLAAATSSRIGPSISYMLLQKYIGSGDSKGFITTMCLYVRSPACPLLFCYRRHFPLILS